MADWLTPQWRRRCARRRAHDHAHRRRQRCAVGQHEPRPCGSGDAPDAVRANRERFAAAIGATPVFLRQVHGARVVQARRRAARARRSRPADASWTTRARRRLHGAGVRLPAGAVGGTAGARGGCGARRLARLECRRGRALRARRVRGARRASRTSSWRGSGPASGPMRSRSAPMCWWRSASNRDRASAGAFAISRVPMVTRDGAPTWRGWHAIGSLRSACAASAVAPGAPCKTAHGSSRFAAMASPGAWPPRSGSRRLTPDGCAPPARARQHDVEHHCQRRQARAQA